MNASVLWNRRSIKTREQDFTAVGTVKMWHHGGNPLDGDETPNGVCVLNHMLSKCTFCFHVPFNSVSKNDLWKIKRWKCQPSSGKMSPQVSKILELSAALLPDLTKMRQAGVWVEANLKELRFSHEHFHVFVELCAQILTCVWLNWIHVSAQILGCDPNVNFQSLVLGLVCRHL